MQTTQATHQVAGLMRPNRIKEKNLLAALETTDRAAYLPPHLAHLASGDAPIPLGNTRGLASPLTQAHLLQELNITEGQNVLILAGNIGYSAALCAAMVGPSGHVTVVEDTADLLSTLTYNLAGFPNVTIVKANPATYTASVQADAALLDATIHQLPAQASGWLKDGATLATIQIQSSGLPAGTLYRKHGKALFEEVIFDIKGQTHDVEDARFLLPQTFVF